MTHSPRPLLTARVLLASSLIVIVGSCGRCADDGGTTSGGSATDTLPPSAIEACRPPATVRGMARDRFIAWARGLDYHPADSGRGMARNFDASHNVQVQAAQGMDTVSRADLARGCLIARIISLGADAAFGIKADTAYVWADSTNPYTATIVPDDGSAGVIYNMDVVTTGGTPPTTTTVPRHICSECGRNDWCVYPRDEIRMVDEAMIGSRLLPDIGGSAVAMGVGASPP